MDKIRSSRELKESMENLERVVNFDNDNVEVHSDMDVVMTDAYDQSIAVSEKVEEIMQELDEKAAEVIVENPEAPLSVENAYTAKLTLDESFKDFTLLEDGRKNRVAARDASEGDKYLEYDMLEFVYELLSAGSKGITSIAPKTPLVYRSKGPGKPLEHLPMKKFSPNGSQIINKGYVALLDLAPTQSKEISNKINRFPEDIKKMIEDYAHNEFINENTVQEVFEKLCERIKPLVRKFDRDAVGYAFLNHLKTLGTPQISEAGNAVAIYSDNLDDFTQAAEGLATYGIECEAPVPKRSRTSHWDYSMIVKVPSYPDGEPMSFEDWLEDNDLELEDVMEPTIAKRFRNRYEKADRENAEVAKKIAFDKWVMYANNHGDEDLDDIYAKMCDDLASRGVECDDKFYAKFMKEFELEWEDDEEQLILKSSDN